MLIQGGGEKKLPADGLFDDDPMSRKRGGRLRKAPPAGRANANGSQ